MLDHFTYTDLSPDGLMEAYCSHYKVITKNDALVLPEKFGHVIIQKLLLPGDISVVFGSFNFLNDTYIAHTAEKEQKFVLWISTSEGDPQHFILSGDVMISEKREQANAFLLNSLFPYDHLRKKGTKGKSILIFIPPYLLESLGKEKSKETLLGKFYALGCQGISLIKLTEIEISKVNDLFIQWEKNKNIIAVSKYAYQLLEWYFTKLVSFLNKGNTFEKLTEQQATDLYALQLLLDNSLHLHKPQIENFEKSTITSLSKLKQLFEKMYTKTLYDYFNEKKMAMAQQLLKNTNKNISEIAYEFGFSNPSNFSAAFKRYYSVTPNEYRQQIKKSILT
jgi:AraC-like DNA-binding protein